VFSGNKVTCFEILTFYDKCVVAIPELLIRGVVYRIRSVERGICPIAAVSTVAEILILEYIRVANLPLTSTVIWPHNSLGLYSISYRIV